MDSAASTTQPRAAVPHFATSSEGDRLYPDLSPNGRARQSGGGFTLMELIIVLTIIVIMSAAVVPVFGPSMAKLQRDHAVRDFVATLRYAQERAVTDTREYRLALDTGCCGAPESLNARRRSNCSRSGKAKRCSCPNA
jgi:prepilin-type N-terminal cleavage/methylation domain-containing protein